MNNHIYTIGREFGSGGKDVGVALAKRLGVKCYDKELLAEAAKESGFCAEIFENHDEKRTNSFLYSLVMDTYSFGGSFFSTIFRYAIVPQSILEHSPMRSKRSPKKNLVSLSADVQIKPLSSRQ